MLPKTRLEGNGGGCALEDAAGPIPRGERILKSWPSAFGGPYVLKGSGIACTTVSKQGSEPFAVNLSKTSKEERTTTESWRFISIFVSLARRGKLLPLSARYPNSRVRVPVFLGSDWSSTGQVHRLALGE